MRESLRHRPRPQTLNGVYSSASLETKRDASDDGQYTYTSTSVHFYNRGIAINSPSVCQTREL